MSYRKYLKDYQLEEYVDEKGRTKTRAVYIAGEYILSPDIPVGDKRLMLAASILSWPAMIGALIPRTIASELAYVILPFVFSALPLFFMTGAVFALVREDPQLTRERADKIASRLPLCPLIAAVLSCVAFLGLVVAAVFIRNDMLSGDLLFGALSLVTAAAASFVFIKCRKLKAYKNDPD